jgi:hypothetical protein
VNADWQNLIVLAAVALAGVYLARVAWRSVARRASACGHCAACPESTTDTEPTVIGIEQLAGKGVSGTKSK